MTVLESVKEVSSWTGLSINVVLKKCPMDKCLEMMSTTDYFAWIIITITIDPIAFFAVVIEITIAEITATNAVITEITITLDLVDHPDRHHQVISVAIIVIATVIQDVTTLVTNVIQAQITTIMEVSTAILALADPIVASILVANASIPIGNVQFSIYFLTDL